MSWVFAGLLACAVIVLIAAEWPRLAARFPRPRAPERPRSRRKGHLRLVDDSDDFAASVERDLAQLPTIDDRD